MDYQKALKILRLKPNFTEEELKKAHRELANIYHPDRNKNPDAEAKMKDVNEARDYLAKYIKGNNRNNQTSYNTHNYNQNTTNIDIKEYINKKAKKLYEITDFNKNKYKVSYNIDYIILEIKFIAIKYVMTTETLKNKQTIDYFFEQYTQEIKKKFEELKIEFYRENNIDENDVKENINYDCTLTEFYENLLKIKEKYGKAEKIKKLLETEIEKYKTYVGYDKISILVEACKNNTFIKIKNNGYKYTGKDIQEMHQEILKCFQIYYSLKQKIDELNNITITIEDKEIKEKYERLKKDFEQGRSFDDIEKGIKELDDLIDKYNKENQKKLKFKKNEQQINQIYQSLITRCSDEIKKYNIIDREQSQIDIQLNLLKELVELFIKGCQEFKDLDYFNLFNEITFIDIKNDNKIKEIIIKKYNSNKFNLNNSRVYIKRKDKISLFGETSFYYLEKDKMQIYQLSGSLVFDKRNITQQELDENYISLDELLDISEYVGKWMINANNFERIYIYYQADGYIIYQNSIDEKIRIVVNPNRYYNCEQFFTTVSDEFKNKKTMQDLIEKQIQKRIDEYNQEKSRNDRRYSFDPNSKEYKNIFGESVFQNYSDFDSYKSDKNFKKRKY